MLTTTRLTLSDMPFILLECLFAWAVWKFCNSIHVCNGFNQSRSFWRSAAFSSLIKWLVEIILSVRRWSWTGCRLSQVDTMIHRLLFLFLTMLLSRLRSRALGKLHELGVLLLTLLGSQGFYGPLRCHQVDVRCINFEVVLNFFSSYSFVRGLGLIFHLRILHAF